MAMTSLQIATHEGTSVILSSQANSSLNSLEMQDSEDSRQFFGSLWIGGRDLDSVAATSNIYCSRKNSSVANMTDDIMGSPEMEEMVTTDGNPLNMSAVRNKKGQETQQGLLQQVCLDQVRDRNNFMMNLYRKFITKQAVVKEILIGSANFMEVAAKEKVKHLNYLYRDIEEWLRAVEAKGLALESCGVGVQSGALKQVVTCIHHYQNGWRSLETEASKLLQLCDSTRISMQDHVGHYSQFEQIIESFASQYAGTFSSVCRAHATKTRPRQSLFRDHFLLLLSMQIYDQMIRQEFQTLAICSEKVDLHLQAIKSLFDRIVELVGSTQYSPSGSPGKGSIRVFSDPMITQGKSLEVELESKTSPQKEFEFMVCSDIANYLRKLFPKVERITLNTVSHFFDSTMYRLKTKSPYMQTCILCRSVGSGFPCLMVIDVSLAYLRCSTS